MSDNESMKSSPQVDGFDSFTDEVEDSEQPSGGIVRGRRIKFTNEATWVFADNEERPPENLDLVAVDILRITQKWVDDVPETRILAVGEKFPNVEKLNEAIPREQWREGFNGQPQGPWENAYTVYLLAPERVDRFTYITSTVGGGIAVRDLAERVNWVRKFGGDTPVYPVVRLRDTFMRTKFSGKSGGRQRPHFEIQRWITFSEGGALAAVEAPALPGPSSRNPAAAEKTVLDRFAGTAAKPEPKPAQGGVQEVQPPTNAEAIDDSIPF